MQRTGKQTKRAVLDNNLIRIYFPYDPVTVAQIKTLPGRKYHGDPPPKHWSCPAGTSAVVSLKGWGFALDDGLIGKFGQELGEQEITEKPEIASHPAITSNQTKIASHPGVVPVPSKIPGFLGELLPFQCYGVGFMQFRKGRMLLADEQGTGKTIHALAYIALNPQAKGPAIAVVPATAKWDWEDKAHTFLKDPGVEVLSGEWPYMPSAKRLLIINYDILAKGPEGQRWVDILISLNPWIIFADEAHRIKNSSAQRTKAVKQLAKGRQFIPMTGTPADKPYEFYNAISMVDPTLFPNWFLFGQRYCNGKHNGFGWDFSGSSNLEEFHDILRNTIMLRRLKKEVLPELPDKMPYSMVPLDLSPAGKREYLRVYKAFMARYESRIAAMKQKMKQEGKPTKEIQARVKGALGAKAVVELEALKQAAAFAKMDSVIEWIQDFLESGQKLVAFATHRNVIDTVMAAFPSIAVKVDGSVTGRARWDAVTRFQEDDSCRLFVGNFDAAGENLTLTAASNVAILEIPNRPRRLMQAEDRTHRIGQKNAVNVYFLLGRETVEVPLAKRLDKMRQVVSKMVDGQELDEGQLIGELFDEITGEASNAA